MAENDEPSASSSDSVPARHENDSPVLDRSDRIDRPLSLSRTGTEPWWRDGKTVTVFTAILAAVIPTVTFIDGMLRNRRDYAHAVLQEQNKIRQFYLERVLDKNVAEIDRKRIFTLLVKLKSDPEFREWAQEQLSEASKAVVQLAEAAQDIETESRVITRQLSNAPSSPAKTRAEENVQAAEAKVEKIRAALGTAQSEVILAAETVAPTPATETATTSAGVQAAAKSATYVVRINDLQPMRAAVESLRAKDFPVDVRKDLHPRASAIANDYPVISIGSRVPVEDAIAVIRLAKATMPWLSFVFIQRDSELDNVIHLSAHVDWIAVKGLQAIDDASFAALTRDGQSQSEFHKAVDSFSLDGSA